MGGYCVGEALTMSSKRAMGSVLIGISLQPIAEVEPIAPQLRSPMPSWGALYDLDRMLSPHEEAPLSWRNNPPDLWIGAESSGSGLNLKPRNLRS